MQLRKISILWRKHSEWRRMSAYRVNRNTFPKVCFRVLEGIGAASLCSMVRTSAIASKAAVEVDVCIRDK